MAGGNQCHPQQGLKIKGIHHLMMLMLPIILGASREDGSRKSLQAFVLRPFLVNGFSNYLASSVLGSVAWSISSEGFGALKGFKFWSQDAPCCKATFSVLMEGVSSVNPQDLPRLGVLYLGLGFKPSDTHRPPPPPPKKEWWTHNSALRAQCLIH